LRSFRFISFALFLMQPSQAATLTPAARAATLQHGARYKNQMKQAKMQKGKRKASRSRSKSDERGDKKRIREQLEPEDNEAAESTKRGGLWEKRDSARGLVAREETNNNNSNSDSRQTKISESSSALRIKDMPRYASESLDDFEIWRSNFKLYLGQFPNETEEMKIVAAKMALQGAARRVVEGDGQFKTVDELLDFLGKSFGATSKNSLGRLLTAKQGPEESVLAYISRVRYNLTAMGVTAEQALDGAIPLLIQGLRPEIGKRLDALCPISFEQAAEIALYLERRDAKAKNAKTTEAKEVVMAIKCEDHQIMRQLTIISEQLQAIANWPYGRQQESGARPQQQQQQQPLRHRRQQQLATATATATENGCEHS
jgi:hypothetical protein